MQVSLEQVACYGVHCPRGEEPGVLAGDPRRGECKIINIPPKKLNLYTYFNFCVVHGISPHVYKNNVWVLCDLNFNQRMYNTIYVKKNLIRIELWPGYGHSNMYHFLTLTFKKQGY